MSQGDQELLRPTIVSWMPFSARFNFKALSPVEVDLLFVLQLLPKALILAFAFPLIQGKQDQANVHPKTHSPRVLRNLFLFLTPGTLPSDVTIAVLAKLDEGNRVHL